LIGNQNTIISQAQEIRLIDFKNVSKFYDEDTMIEKEKLRLKSRKEDLT
jgi:hypothetical protein